jgi:hypothetical protein
MRARLCLCVLAASHARQHRTWMPCWTSTVVLLLGYQRKRLSSQLMGLICMQALTLDVVRWLGDITHLPVVIKGVLRGDDAAAVASLRNVRAVIVSNHGGRQLDGAVPPLAVLPEVSAQCAPIRAIHRRRSRWTETLFQNALRSVCSKNGSLCQIG